MQVESSSGLVFEFSDSGALRSIVVDPIRIGIRPPSPFSRSGANLYLRKLGGAPTYTPLLGPLSGSSFRAAEGGFEARGSWEGLDYVCVLQLSETQLAWQWRVTVQSEIEQAAPLDLIYVQDVGLQANNAGLVNESYVSQYLERRVFEHPQHGAVVACRQNMKAAGQPWLLLACAGRASAASTDGLQFFGPTFRATGEPEGLRAPSLGGELSGEASIVAIQEAPFVLAKGRSHTSAFVAVYEPDHPAASSEQDSTRLAEVLRGFGNAPQPTAAVIEPVRDRFQCARLLQAEDLSAVELGELFGSEWRHVERAAESGALLSFFPASSAHVVLRAKELLVDRPHGHIMQAKQGTLPDESMLSTTAFACGVFNSHITQGNTNFSTLLSVCTNPSTPAFEGQRLLVQLADGEYLLGVPSAFVMGLNYCTWIYKRDQLCFQVRTWTDAAEPRIHFDFKVLRGSPLSIALTHQLDALNGWSIRESGADQYTITPRAGGMLSEQFPGAQFRMLLHSSERKHVSRTQVVDGDDAAALFVIERDQVTTFGLSFIGEVTGPSRAAAIQDADAAWRSAHEAALQAWRELSRELTLRGPEPIAAIREVLPWYGLNALIHFLTPYGLEQFSGAAWGTRDVCQGPIELLLSQEKYAEVKQVLRILFSHQNQDGGWPQWWMFDRFKAVRADSAHGDVIYWCILALCSYIKASGDFTVLEEQMPFFQQQGSSPLVEHVDRIVEMIVRSFVPNTALVEFGGGDWNDSLQPVSKDLARRLISSWTVQMSYQALSEYRDVCALAGDKPRAQRMGELAERIVADFQRHLVRDGIVAGYGLVAADGSIDVLLHPRDTTTGVKYSLLPMNRGVISGVFDKEQAERHLALIHEHLTGPDGARLMDRPLRYHGGPQSIFQRAESSTYFGREIGLMYVHEHLRFAESQARLGKPAAFLHALRQAIPVDYRQVVPQGELRQSNCYYSSSDVMFKSRYEADALYSEVIAGKTPLKGGWRVYSSGPGIYVALIVSRLLGLRIELGNLLIDPVLAPELDGLQASLDFRGRPVTFTYRVTGQGFGPQSISVNAKPLLFKLEANRYRSGGAVVPLTRFMGMLDAQDNNVEIEV